MGREDEERKRVWGGKYWVVRASGNSFQKFFFYLMWFVEGGGSGERKNPRRGSGQRKFGRANARSNPKSDVHWGFYYDLNSNTTKGHKKNQRSLDQMEWR